jgi:hypothetical protein
MDDAGRKRHLEALFADEPFLSPTMKARRMHEKLYEMRALETDNSPRAGVSTLGLDSPFQITAREEPAFLRPDFASSGAPRISFADAVARLHGSGSGGSYDPASDAIERFRAQVLAVWVQKVDRRETDSGESENVAALGAQVGTAYRDESRR